MQTYEIIVNGQYLDTYSDVNISLNYQLSDVLDIASKTTNWTRTITLPGTANNNKFFKHIYDVNIDTETFNPLKKVPGVIKVGNEIIFNGNLQLKKINVIQGNVEYDIEIFGVLNNIINQTKDLELQDLDLSKYNHIRNKTNIINSLDYSIIVNNEEEYHPDGGIGYVYPYIIYNSKSLDNPNAINIYDSYPAVYAREIFKMIIENQGYTIKSDFLESKYAKSLILPFTKDKIELADDIIDRMGSVIGVSNTRNPFTLIQSRGTEWERYFNLPALTRETGTVDASIGELEFKDKSNQFTPNSMIIPNDYNGGYWICDKQGYYDIDVNLKLYAEYTRSNGNDIQYSAGSGAFEYYYRLWVTRAANGQTQLLDSSVSTESPDGKQYFTPSSGNHTSPWYDTGVPILINLSVSEALLCDGDKVFVEYGFRYPGNVNWSGSNTNVTARLFVESSVGDDFSVFRVIPSNNADMGNTLIDMTSTLPEKYKQSEFLNDFIKSFNLIITDDKDNSNVLIIEPEQDYLASGGEILDWNLKYDEATGYQSELMVDLNANIIEFTHTEDKDYLNESYQEVYKNVYSAKQINIGNDYNDNKSIIKVGFAATPITEQYVDGRVAPLFLKEDDDKLKGISVKPRLLFYNGRIKTSDLTTAYQDFPGEATNLSQYSAGYAYAGMWDNPYEPQYDLGWDSTKQIYWNTNSYPVQNLFNKFYYTKINNLINPNNKMITAKFRLSYNDIAKFDFRNIIYFLGSYWRVNEIKNFDPSIEGLTTVVLYKILDTYTIEKITNKTSNTANVCPVDIVVKKNKNELFYASKSGEYVSEDCCTFMGGNWRNSICYLTNISDAVNDNSTSINDTGIKPTIKPGVVISKNPSKDFSTNINNGYGNTINGDFNVIPEGVNNVTVIGNNVSVPNNTQNSLIIGDNVDVNNGNGFYANTVNAENIVTDNLNGVPIDEAIPQSFIDLDDTPNDYDGLAGYKVVVNDAEDGLEFIPDSSSSLTGSTSINIVSNSIQRAELTGDVTSPLNSNVTTISDNVVTNTKLADMPTMTIKGNNTAVTGDPLDLTIDQLKAMLENSTAITQANLGILCSSGTVVPDKLYRVTDCGNTIFRGVTENTVKSEYVVTRSIKPEYYIMSTGGNNKGIISLGITYTSGNYAIWGGKMWLKGSGTTLMSVLPTDNLNPNIGGSITNWTQINDTSNVYYEYRVLAVDGDIFDNHNNWIIRGSNNNNIVANMISNTGGLTNIPFSTRLRCDWGGNNMKNNTATLIMNNALYELTGGGLLPIYNNNINGGIYCNSIPGMIAGNETNGSIIYNNNIGNIILNSNDGNISYNVNGGEINNNSNGDAISGNSNGGPISNNSSGGTINNNSNIGSISGNNTAGIINDNSNVGEILYNNNKGYILSNSNIGDINFNDCGYIILNSNNGTISNNSNIGDICYNYQHTTYPTAPANILYNSNNGSIGGLTSSLGNRMRGNIIYNSNNGDINKNTNTGLYSYYYNDTTISAQIGNNNCDGPIFNNSNSGGIAVNSNGHEIVGNSNNGAISNNKNTGRINNNSNNGYINNNKNNGSIAGNSNRGYIADNMNNGAINNNTSASASYFNNYISNNRNNGYINNNNFTANSVHISFNNNNGTIGSGSTTNRNTIINDIQVNK